MFGVRGIIIKKRNFLDKISFQKKFNNNIFKFAFLNLFQKGDFYIDKNHLFEYKVPRLVHSVGNRVWEGLVVGVRGIKSLKLVPS